MSEFRIFCIACFVGMGATAAAANHGLVDPNLPNLSVLLMGLTLGFAAVALFGRWSA